MTSDADRRLLLDLARAAVAAHVSGRPLPSIGGEGAAAKCGGAFVTLHKQGDLRGCIGHVDANEKLGIVIVRCAVQACSADPRFPPVAPHELAFIDLELSLLGSLEVVVDVSEIEVGRHGLVIEDGWHRGLLLPQVAVEWGWSREAFLIHTCRKAGLPPDAWRKGARIWRFEAEVFGSVTSAE